MKSLLALPLAITAAALVGSAARADGCPEARSLRLARSFAEAELAARTCLGERPEDVGTWLELSRALGLQERFGPALEWAERGLERYPEDIDIQLWQVRLLAWTGRLDEAQQRLSAVRERAPDVMRDRETAMLAADLRYWSHDWAGADQGFSSYLESWPDDADARLKRGIVRDRLEQESASFDLALESSFSTGERWHEIATRLGVMARVVDELSAGAAFELRDRDGRYDMGTATLAYGLVRWRGDGAALEAGIGGALGGAGYAPELSAWIEPTLKIADPLWASLRYWRLGFADTDGASGSPSVSAAAGAHVVSPAVTVVLDPVELDLRYWLGLEDSGKTTHAGLLRARWAASQAWALEVGGGAGNAADYLQPRSGDSGGHWLALCGVRFTAGWRHRFSAGYVQRHEAVEGRTELRHEVSLGWQVTL